jgi:hypothetical protein
MNQINITTTQAEITITDNNGAITAVTTPSTPSILTAYTAGPQGAAGAAITSIGEIPDVDTTGVTDGAILTYNEAISKFTANSTWTTASLTDGGNF